MNAARLLAMYERIAEAPDAVARLRRFVRDLAVRGKLVPQDPGDEPASTALRRIKAGGATDGAFQLPSSWLWVTVGAVADTRLGKMLDKAKNRGTPRPYLRNINVRWFGFDLTDLMEMPFEDRELEEFALRQGDVLICEGGEPGRAAVWRGDAEGLYFQKAIHRVRFRGTVDPDFFVNAIRASADDGCLAESFTGTGIKHFTGKGLDGYRFPLPPLAEQHRIVAKVDELMALCDRLEAARTAREATRDRLAAASLARLNTPDPETFPADARFALDALPALTTRPDQIKHLRQTILNLAVRGKLVPQDPRDEPALALLRRVTATACVPRREREPEISRPLHDIPEHWSWTTLGEILTFGPQNGLSPKPTKRTDAPKAITLTATTSGVFDPAHFKHVDAPSAAIAAYWLEDGDLLFQRGNTRDYVGIAAVYRGPPRAFLFPDLIIRVRISAQLSLPYVHLAAIAPPSRQFLVISASGAQATMPKINQAILCALPLPIPPLAEQQRIVAKVTELMALCDALEASLAAATTVRTRLLEAALAEALMPAAATAFEAAE